MEINYNIGKKGLELPNRLLASKPKAPTVLLSPILVMFFNDHFDDSLTIDLTSFTNLSLYITVNGAQRGARRTALFFMALKFCFSFH